MKQLFIGILLWALIIIPVKALDDVKIDDGGAAGISPAGPADVIIPEDKAGIDQGNQAISIEPTDARTPDDTVTTSGEAINSNDAIPETIDNPSSTTTDLLTTTGEVKANDDTKDPNYMMAISSGVAPMTLLILGIYVLIRTKKR